MKYQVVKSDIANQYDCLTKIDTVRLVCKRGLSIKEGIQIYNELYNQY
jgi:hypothetical protein